jgi:hypothetical protein
MGTHAQGTTFSFGGTSYTVTNITYSMTDVSAGDTIDISNLAITAGNSVRTMDRPLKGSATDTGREVSIEYLGTAPITDGLSGSLVIAGGPFGLTANATVSSSSVTLAVNDVIRGQASFRVQRI